MKQVTPEEFDKLKQNEASQFTGVIVSKLMGWKRYYFKGQLHREDGPAYECADGSKEWWWYGTIIYISGFIYKTPDINFYSKSKHLKDLEYIELGIVKGNTRPGLDQICFRKVICEEGIFYIPILPGM